MCSSMLTSDELDRYFNRGLHFSEEIRRCYPSIWSAAGAAIAKAGEVMHMVHDNSSERTQEFLNRLGLWGAVRRYQISSILEIFSRNLDEGLALLRMATEVTRVLKAVSTDPAVWAIWVKGDERKSAEFKRAAKFDLTDPVQKAVFAAYNFCTDYGTHGHRTSALYLVETPMGREPSMAGVAAIAKSWFVHCVAMHRLSLKCLVDDSSDLFFACELGLTVAEARLLERIQNDGFFRITDVDGAPRA